MQTTGKMVYPHEYADLLTFSTDEHIQRLLKIIDEYKSFNEIKDFALLDGNASAIYQLITNAHVTYEDYSFSHLYEIYKNVILKEGCERWKISIKSLNK